jgi:hypothetical protein
LGQREGGKGRAGRASSYIRTNKDFTYCFEGKTPFLGREAAGRARKTQISVSKKDPVPAQETASPLGS